MSSSKGEKQTHCVRDIVMQTHFLIRVGHCTAVLQLSGCWYLGVIPLCSSFGVCVYEHNR